jgi:hypothetical protein
MFGSQDKVAHINKSSMQAQLLAECVKVSILTLSALKGLSFLL